MASHDHWKSTGSKDIHHEHCNISSKCVTPVARKEVKRLERSLFGLVKWTESKEVSQHCRQVMGELELLCLKQSLMVCTCICGKKARRLIASGNEEDWARLLVEDVRENLLEEELVFHQKWHAWCPLMVTNNIFYKGQKVHLWMLFFCLEWNFKTQWHCEIC